MKTSDDERKDVIRRLVQQVEKIAECHEVSRQNILDAFWENYFVTRRPEDLAIYVEAGGEIDDIARQAIVRALRGRDKPPHGSSKVMGDIEFYTRVRLEQTLDSFAKAIAVAKSREKGQTVSKEKKMSLEEIFARIASEIKLSERGVKAKYDRGRKAARERLGIGNP